MSAKTAEVFGLSDRGRVAQGCWADLVVFDPQTVVDRGTFINPVQYPLGIRHVLVNGEPVLEEGLAVETARHRQGIAPRAPMMPPLAHRCLRAATRIRRSFSHGKTDV